MEKHFGGVFTFNVYENRWFNINSLATYVKDFFEQVDIYVNGMEDFYKPLMQTENQVLISEIEESIIEKAKPEMKRIVQELAEKNDYNNYDIDNFLRHDIHDLKEYAAELETTKNRLKKRGF